MRGAAAGSVDWAAADAAARGTPTGRAMAEAKEERTKGEGPPHVTASLRLHGAKEEEIRLTYYRDHAGWCPYCQKTWNLIEEKKIPCRIERINMRSYGPKPRAFLDKVRGGLLPVIELDGQVVTESLVIMQLLEQEFPGGAFGPYGPAALPGPGDKDTLERSNRLLKAERQLFGAWCNLAFRPSAPAMPSFLNRGGGGGKSQAMGAFEAQLDAMDAALGETPGPFFNGGGDPDIVDWQYVSHVERMNASVLYWKGLQVRGSGRWPHIDAWFDAFEERPAYMATKSDYYTHIMAEGPQYGPGYPDEAPEAKAARAAIGGKDGWTLAAADAGRDLEPYTAAERAAGPQAWRHEAAASVAANGAAVSRFACRGMGEADRSYQAPLSDPLAKPDLDWEEDVSRALVAVCAALLDDGGPLQGGAGAQKAAEAAAACREAGRAAGTAACLEYLRDRVGVPRDMSYPAAMQLRGALNWFVGLLGGGE